MNIMCLMGFLLTSPLAGDQMSRFEKIELFSKVLFLIENQYYRPVDTEVLIQGAIKGMMNTLDPHSTFLDKKIFAKMKEDTSGEFGGLGIEVSQKDGVLVVTTPIDDTPAFKAGIKPGDKIVEINGANAVGLTLDEADHQIRGKPGTKITLGIDREGVKGLIHFTLERKIIKLSAVKSKLIKKRYAYVRLIQFQKNCTQQVVASLKKLRKEAVLAGLVLDLRSNPGGLLDEAVDLASIFLKEGVVVSTEGRDPKHKEIRYVKKGGHKELDIPMVVLVNGASASASEIVAGALQDSRRALIMGTPTFGKGSVQSVAKIDADRGVKLTIAQYMTPSKKKIQAVGIKPDVLVDEYEAAWVEKNRRTDRVVREIDLRNHLTASIETEEEKAARLRRKKEERQNRIRRLRKAQKKPAKKSHNPTFDYQVIQAVGYLKNFSLIKDIHAGPKR